MDGQDSSEWENEDDSNSSSSDLESASHDQQIGVPMHRDFPAAVRRGMIAAKKKGATGDDPSDDGFFSDNGDSQGGDPDDGAPEEQPSNPPPPTVMTVEDCWLCTFCSHPKAKSMCAFICANTPHMSTQHMVRASHANDRVA